MGQGVFRGSDVVPVCVTDGNVTSGLVPVVCVCVCAWAVGCKEECWSSALVLLFDSLLLCVFFVLSVLVSQMVINQILILYF